MTMADTVAVMNHGRIEQIGSPVDLYEHPATTFVANFLGQSNLVDGRVVDRDGDLAVVDVQGHRLGVPTERVHAAGDAVHLGVRPEKVAIQVAADGPDTSGCNSVPGVVLDSSFIGVSTEYLVRLPWAQTVSVVAQNITRDPRLVPGCDVVLTWDRGHTFALDAAQAIDDGVERLAAV